MSALPMSSSADAANGVLIDTALTRRALNQSSLGLLKETRSFFRIAVQALAEHCVIAGVIDAERVDAQQAACFELAWASALDLLDRPFPGGAGAGRP